ncbi:MAG: lysine--tRNA ligase [Geminicoccaceae bacterium]
MIEDLVTALGESKAWPAQEAQRLAKRLNKTLPSKGFVLFQTGYGPSGLPHIGTFGEVFRTTMVRHVFERLTGLATELYAFSDDLDGLRKVPENVPNRDMVAQHLHKPLTAIPDPYGEEESYGAYMNKRLKRFLDHFGFDHTFQSATEVYKSGRFNEVLLRVLAAHDAICRIVMPSLGGERRATYSPILPICQRTGRVLQVPLEETRPDAGTVIYRDPETGALIEQAVTDGSCKLQWRADWALRWTALDVDYEMFGKDLIDSARLGGRIAQTIGGRQPEGFQYEHFLDEHGHKISKSVGNGMTIDEWLRYGTEESLSLFMFQSPKKAKRLHFDVIPRHVDDYETFLGRFPGQTLEQRLANPVWHLHRGQPPEADMPVTYAMLLNLASVVNAEDGAILWNFIQRYRPGATPETLPRLDALVRYAVNYYQDIVKPTKRYRAADDRERDALFALNTALDDLPAAAEAEAIQNVVYEVGKAHQFENLRDWFKALYQVLLGQDEGPRFGSFVQIYGVAETRSLIEKALAGELLSANAGQAA